MHITDYKKWQKAAKAQGVRITFTPGRFGKHRELGQDEKGDWLPPTFGQINNNSSDPSKPHKK